MKIENSIGWCDATINAVTGCDKVSPGCAHCYAEVGIRGRILRSQGIETWGPKGVRVPVNFEPTFRRLDKLCICDKCHEAHRWLDEDGRMKNYQCIYCGVFDTLRRIRLFADSNSDWLDDKWPVEILARFLDAIRRSPNIDVLLLTKRIDLWRERLTEVRHAWSDELNTWTERWLHGHPPFNVWIGVSVEDQSRAIDRIPVLLDTPAAVRFLSIEPLLRPIDYPFSNSKLNWAIVGGESGNNFRDCGIDAILGVVQQCQALGIPVYVKQDAGRFPGHQGRIPDDVWKMKNFPYDLRPNVHSRYHR